MSDKINKNMDFITYDNLNVINIELTDYCNAACPMCARTRWDGFPYSEKINKNHNTYNFVKEKIPLEIIKRLKKFYSIGTFGDPLMNPDTVKIFQYVKKNNQNCKLMFHTNGGGRDHDFWKDLGNLGMKIFFSIDGLEDTNHIYRKNVKWEKLMSNVNSFIQSGGIAMWKFLVFKHNEHQIYEAEKLSKELGFQKFYHSWSDRWNEYNWVTGEIRNLDVWPTDHNIQKPISQNNNIIYDPNFVKVSKKKFNLQETIPCWACNNKYEIYIRANGNIQPCCMLGDLDVHEAKRLIDDLNEVNLHHRSLQEILGGSFFKKLSEGISGSNGKYRLQNCFRACGTQTR